MIPYIQIPSLPIVGPLAIQPFGVLVATGVLLGAKFVTYEAKRLQIPADRIDGAIRWSVGIGFIGAHVFEILMYHPDRLVAEGPLVLLKIWDGISSFGGFLGAVLGLLYYFYRIGQRNWWREADTLMQGLVLGWVFGRLGCTIAHDHPGALTDFALAVNYPGGARYDLGLYEFLYTVLVMVPAILFFRRPESLRHHRPGFFVGLIAILYAPVRFAFDFLRAEDVDGADLRFQGLTFAQYCCVALLLAGVFIIRRARPVRA